MSKAEIHSGSGCVAYGALARRVAGSIAREQSVVVFDHTGASEALRDCMTRKFNGEPFVCRAILPRESSIRADLIAPTVIATYATADERRLAFAQTFAGVLQVNGQLLRDIPIYASPHVRLMQAALRLADGIIVSSESERRRIAELLNAEPPARIVGIDDPIVPIAPGLRTTKQDAVVIWAPDLTGEAASAFAVALTELRIPLLVVSNTPTPDGLAQWLPLDRASEALARAKAIVDTSAYGCDAIRRLGTWQVPIVADVESGAQEVFDGLRTFDRQRFESIFEALIAAIGAPPPRLRQASSARAIEIPESNLLLDGPRVSVILPTLDRPDMIQEAIESIGRQSYRNVEPIVVIDGGPSLSHLEPLFPNVRFIHMAENNPVVSTNTAFAAATGEYIAILNDDDLFFPDHIAALVSALERSGASVAHGDVMTAYLRGDRGDWHLYGLESNMSRATDASAFLVSNQIGATSCLFRRSCIEGDEPFDASIPFYRDYELWLRLALKNDFVHVERITSCYTIRNQGARQQSVMWRDQTVEAYESIYTRYPLHDRPLVQQRRDQIMVSARSGLMELQPQPAAEIQPISWPLWRTP